MKFCQNLFLKILAVCFFYNFQELYAQGITEKLLKLSEEERESLKYFFTAAIKQDHLGHVLFFSTKPACLIARSLPENQMDDDFFKGWNVWKENEALFPHPNFLIYHEFVHFKDGNSALHIYFINKRTLLSLESTLLEKNGNSGDITNIKDFISRLEGCNSTSLFYADEAFVGFLMGFGIESSKQYKENRIAKSKVLNKLEPILCAKDEQFKLSKDQSESTPSMQKCLASDTASVLPVSFLGDPDSKEVKFLRGEYAKELEHIQTVIQADDLLTVSLRSLCGN